MVGARKNKNMTQDTYKFVPLLDFNRSWNDLDLFSLFNLNADQIDYIKTMITDYDENIIDELEGDDFDE